MESLPASILKDTVYIFVRSSLRKTLNPSVTLLHFYPHFKLS